MGNFPQDPFSFHKIGNPKNHLRQIGMRILTAEWHSATICGGMDKERA